MSRAHGRRVAARAPRGGSGPWPLVAALLLVPLTVGALVAAGASDNVTGEQPAVASRLDVGTRSFVCTGGLPGTTAVAGTVNPRGTVTVNGGAPPTGSVRVHDPADVVADPAASTGAFAAQQAGSPRWLAAAGCPEPRPTWWFVGAGASDRHDTVLTIANPRPGTAIFDVDVIGADGPVDAPGLHGLTLASGATRTLDLARVAAATGDLAVRVQTSQGLVAAGAAESWAEALIGKTVHEWVPPQGAAARNVDLAGVAGDSSSTLVLANPGAREAVVRMRLVGKNGTFNPTRHASLTVSPGSIETVDVSDVVRSGTDAVRLAANVPVVATLRSVHQRDEGYAVAARPVHGSGAVAVPAGVRAGIVLASVPVGRKATDAAETQQQTQPAAQQPSSVRLRVLGRHGHRLRSLTVTVPAAGSVTTSLPRAARSVAVSVSDGGVVGAVVLRSGPGIAALPLVRPVAAQRRPGVVPGW